MSRQSGPCDSLQHETRHGIIACRKRLRRSRAVRKVIGGAPGIVQVANRESPPLASAIDRRAPRRARFEVKEEADAA